MRRTVIRDNECREELSQLDSTGNGERQRKGKNREKEKNKRINEWWERWSVLGREEGLGGWGEEECGGGDRKECTLSFINKKKNKIIGKLLVKLF